MCRESAYFFFLLLIILIFSKPASASSFVSRIRIYEQDVVETSSADFEFEIRVDRGRIFRAFTETEYLRWLVSLRGAAQYNQVRENVRQTLRLTGTAVWIVCFFFVIDEFS